MGEEEIRAATLDVVEARLASIAEGTAEGYSGEEVGLLIARRDELVADGRREARSLAAAAIESGEAREVQIVPTGAEGRAQAPGLASEEYRRAWLKSMARSLGVRGFDTDLTDVESRAYTHTTTNSGDLLPTTTANRIIELVESSSTLFADVTTSSFTNVFEVPRHKSIDAGDADVTEENTANDDEQDTFDNISLTGEEIRKHIVVSRKMMVQSIDAFEEWIVRHISARMTVALDKQTISDLTDSTKGMASTNKVQTAAASTLTDDDLIGAFALLSTGGESGGTAYIYANNKTIWNRLATVRDANKRPIYQASTDPALRMLVHGFGVKQDDNIADDVIMVGYPDLIEANMFDPISVMADVDVKTRAKTVSGYCLYESALGVPSSWVQLTVKADS